MDPAASVAFKQKTACHMAKRLAAPEQPLLYCFASPFLPSVINRDSARTKPRASAEGLEWHLMPHWSGKALVKDEMKRTYPPYVHLAADIAKDTNGTKVRRLAATGALRPLRCHTAAILGS